VVLLSTHAAVPALPHDRARFWLNVTLTNVLVLASIAPSNVVPVETAPFENVVHVPVSEAPHDRPTSSRA
jgi:hypothetical protein